MAALEQPEMIPGQITIDEAIAEVEQEGPNLFTNVTPNGTTIQYCPKPRFYRVNGEDVPSVSSILDELKKGGLSHWGMKVGVEGVLELFERGVLSAKWPDQEHLTDVAGGKVTSDDVLRFLKENKLTVRETLEKAGDRGTSVHGALEQWAEEGIHPHPEVYPESEKGYVEALCKFLIDWGPCRDIASEVMVGSAKHKYAGRPDLGCSWGGGPMVVRTYPKWPNKIAELPAGRWLLDAKTSKDVYKSHALQLAGYSGASDECGYEHYDYTAVLHLKLNGEYELIQTTATLDDFLAVRSLFDVMQKKLVV